MFKRMSNLVRGFFSLFISGLERQNPEALLEVEQENLRKQVGQYNQGLASHAGLCERLISQVKQLENDERDLRAKATANLRAGNRDTAAQYALRLQTVQRELEENRNQQEQAEKTYKDLVKARDVAISAARSKIEALKSSISDLKMKRAMAELTEMASGMITGIGNSGETLDRLQNIVEEERSKAAGRARVARDSLDTSGIQIKEAEQNALAEQALADFAAKEGIALDPATPSASASASSGASGSAQPVKSMGPTAEKA
ncbi:MAG TPA: PspA/IM30 family protein [Terriglobales bacterium]|jgi:phage shock protein A|nr:PspA/IM30 family protein [Terriglobales bacterium]